MFLSFRCSTAQANTEADKRVKLADGGPGLGAGAGTSKARDEPRPSSAGAGVCSDEGLAKRSNRGLGAWA